MATKPAYLPPPKRFEHSPVLSRREAVKIALDTVMSHATFADADVLIDQLQHQGYWLQDFDRSLPA